MYRLLIDAIVMATVAVKYISIHSTYLIYD